MRIRIALSIVLAAVSMAASVPSHAGTRTVTEDYVGSFDPLSFGRCAGGRVPMNVGKVCIPVRSTDLRVTLSITDTLPDAAFFYRFMDSSGTCVGEPDDPLGVCPNMGSVCKRVNNLAVPSRAAVLEVFPSGFVLGPVNCVVLEDNGIGAAVAGKITAAFTTSL